MPFDRVPLEQTNHAHGRPPSCCAFKASNHLGSERETRNLRAGDDLRSVRIDGHYRCLRVDACPPKSPRNIAGAARMVRLYDDLTASG